MRKQLLPFLLLLNIAAFGQKNLSSSLQRSVYTYVYRVNLKEAEQLYRKGIHKVSEKQLYDLVDSFQKEEPAIKAGNYLFVHADDNQLVYEVKAIGDVAYKIINNNRDLVIALHTKDGRLIKAATVSINNKALQYDEATQTFRRDKYNKEGTLQVTVDGVLYRFPLKKGYAPRTTFFGRITRTTPLKFIVNPFRKLFGKAYHRRYNFYYSTAYEGGFKGFMVTNQPKYKPGDTVRLKAFVTAKNGKPVTGKLWLRLSERSGDVDTVIAGIAPYRPGGYEASFVLSDSLNLDLDKDYLLTLEESNPQKAGEDDDEEKLAARRKVVMRGKFYFEEYELDAITFSARSDKKEHGRGEAVSVYAKAADAADMAVMDGRIKLIVSLLPYSTKTFTAPTVFLPDTLWQYEGALEPLGETKINIPDSAFPRASFSYQIECIFLNSNNEMQSQTLSQTFTNKTARIAFDLQGDSLHIDYLVKGQPSRTNAMLYGMNDNDDTLLKQAVHLPATIKADAFVKRYEVEADSLHEEYEIESRQSIVSAVASRTKDSVAVQLANPSHLPVWYTIFAGAKVVLRGYGDSLNFVEPVRTPENYFVSLQYILGDKVHSEEYTVPYRDKFLTVRVHQPEAVYPGQTAKIEIDVRDAENNPVSNADVTAYAFTKKFDGYQRPNVPYLGKLYPGRGRYAPFEATDEEEDYRYHQKLAWERWSREMHLDTIEYYKFLHPQTLYVNTEPAADSLTQLAPFVVKDGSLQPVHHLYIDEVPVFFSAAQNVQRYSFAVQPGKHSLRLRTYDALISLDSFDVAKGVKTFVSMAADTSNHRIRIQSMPDTLTAYEKGMWGRYSLLLENSFGERYAYVNSGNQLLLLNNNSNPVLLSPLPNRYATLTVKNGFTQAFEAEGGYHYFIEKGLIKQKQLKNPYPFSTHLSHAEPRYNFRDYVLTEGEIDSLWQGYLYNRSASTDLFINPSINKTGNGALQIGITKDSGGKEPFIRNVLLFKYDDPDFLRIYRGTARDLGFLQPGTYRLLFLLKEDAYFIRDSINIKKDGINYYETGIINPKGRDSVSIRISDIINNKERWSSYNTQDFNSIKESFNQQYFDASLFTETISGVVRDDKGTPVAGASVFIKGTRSGTVTNGRGEFILRTLPNSTLIVAYVGYTSIERKVKDGDYTFKLSAAKQMLNEVVVVGYGTTRKADIVGSVSSISENMLAGKMAGIMIRGTSSIQADAPLLIIVDGLPFSGSLKDIDPSLIVGMNVLKDAAATAIYGDKAAAGVIIITTKGLQRSDAMNGLESIPVANTLRKAFHDYAYWQPKLTTDASGKATFTVTYPDDITAWRGFAIAITDKKQSGFAETMVKSFKAISGNLSLPQFAVAGDTLNIIGKSLNYLADSIEARRTFAVNNATVKEGIIRFRNSWIDTFTVAAPVADSMKMKYTIQKADGYFDGEERSLPIYKQGVAETEGMFAALRSDTSFTLQPLSDTGTVKLYAETSVIPSLEQEIESIRRYEYLCNEQLASKLKAMLVQKRIDSFYKRPFRGEKNVRELIGKLQQSKTAGGLWGWWTGNEPTMWISLHVAEALAEATTQGYAVQWNKQALIDYLVFNLESYRGTESLSALHLLQLLNAKADYKKYTDTLQMHLPKMSLYEKLRLAELKQKGGLDFTVDSLLSKQNSTMFGNIYFGEEGYRLFDNSIQNTLSMYRILQRMGKHESELEKMRGYFLERRKSGAWRNTYESSLILETILPDILVNDSLPKAPTLSFDGGLAQTVVRFPFATEVKSGSAITVRKEGRMPVYFTAYQQYWNAAPKKVSGDFAVTSTFVKNDDAATRLKAGEPVVMKITVSVKADANYVMIEAPIPAGCSYKDKAQSYANNEVHREYFKNKVSIFCSELKKGTYNFNVSLLPRYAGIYTLNPAKAEMMYFPVFYGREGMKKVTIGNGQWAIGNRQQAIGNRQ